MLTRRNFNHIFLSAIGISIYPTILFANKYSGPINWVGNSFIAKASDIESDFPLTKPASEILSDDNSTFFNSMLIEILRANPLKNVDLKLEGYAENAKLALTFGFSAEFDFGKFDDKTDNTSIYLIYSFGQSILYNPKSRIIISSVPIRHIAPHVIKNDEIQKFKNIKIELMKRSFYNNDTPEQTYIQQFRNMLEKQSFKKIEWKGKKPKVTDVMVPDKIELFNNFGLSKEKFREFVGQSATFAFGYKLNRPIIPFMKTKGLGVTTIMRFNAATKLYQAVATKLPKPDLDIQIIHRGWRFKEEQYIKGNKNIVKVKMGMGLRVKIYDLFDELKLYDLSFIATKTFLENTGKVMRSDAATVCEMTEALLERVFESIYNKNYRNILKKGEKISSQENQYSATFKVTKKSSEVMLSQSEKVLAILPPV